MLAVAALHQDQHVLCAIRTYFAGDADGAISPLSDMEAF